MSHTEFRRLERMLRAEGRLADFVMDVANELDDPELIANLVDRLSYKLTVPVGQLLILNTDEPMVIRPYETVTYPIFVPEFEGRRGTICCFRYVWTSTGSIAWELGVRGGRGFCNSDGYIEAGQYSVPMASDPFEIYQASILDVCVSSQELEDVDATFTLLCRHQITEWKCLSCKKVVGIACNDCRGSGCLDDLCMEAGLGACVSSCACPECCPSCHRGQLCRACGWPGLDYRMDRGERPDL